MKITKTKSGSYRSVVAVGRDSETGKQIVKTFTAQSKTELRQKVDEAKEQYRHVSGSSMTFQNAAESFMGARQPVVSPNTYNEYRSRLLMLQRAFPAFCDTKVYEITTDDVQTVLNAFLKPYKAEFKRANAKEERLHEMKACSGKTVRNYWTFINSVLKHKNIHIQSPKLPQKKRPDIYVPSDDEMKFLLSKAEGELSVCIRLAAFGPLREGEVCALSVSDISGNIVHVHKDIVYEAGGGYSVKDVPKTTASNRYIEYPQALIEEIQEQGYITTYNPKQLRYHFNRLLKECGLPQFRFHDLRHYGASTLHAQGVPDAYIMRRGGWATDSTLKAVYRHTLADQDKVMTDKAISHFNTIC